MQDAVLSPPLGEVLNRVLGRHGDSMPAPVPARARTHVVLDEDLPDRILADREIGGILESLLADSGATTLRLGESAEVGDVDRWLRPTFTWLRIELRGTGVAGAAERIEALLGAQGYRRLERIRLENAEGTLALYWRTDSLGLPMMVEQRHSGAEERLGLLFPQIRF